MENYVVSARKYRPMSFDTVVGQGALTVTLKNAIKSDRLAHAYLFCGPRGVGKTTCARIFAKTINCLSPKENGEACGECESCKAFDEQRSYNIHELDAASNNSVDDIRQLIEQVRIPPQIGKYKVFIIDEVHMLSQAAFNAFLKTLEEPPHHAIFILATTEKHKLLPTILSRCQIYDFNRMSVVNIVNHLKNVAEKEGITAEEAALNVIAQKADGGMRDALSIFDQVASFCGGNITYQRTIENLNVLDHDYYFKLTDYFLEEKITECMITLNEILSKGFDGQHFITGLASHFRNLLVCRDEQTVGLMEASDEVRSRYREQAQKCKPQFLFRAMKLANTCDLNYKQSQNKRLLVELTLIETAQLSSDDGASSGRSPIKILKPIFAQSKAAGQAGVHVQTANQNSSARSAVAASAGGNASDASAYKPDTNALSGLLANKNIGEGQRPVTRVSSFSLRQAPKGPDENKQESVVAKATQQTETADKPFNENELIVAWRSFANQLTPDEVAMTKQMNNIEPALKDDFNVCVTVDNPIQLDNLTKYIPLIEEYLKKELSNSKIKISTRISEATERKKVYTPYEQMNNIMKQNSVFKKLKDAFSLELC